MTTTTRTALTTVTAELATATSLVPARLARGSSAHCLAEYQARYAAEALELAAELAANPYTRHLAR